MGNSTFSGPVRSENGFQVVSRNATTGCNHNCSRYSLNSGIVTGTNMPKARWLCTLAVTESITGNSGLLIARLHRGEFTQPANIDHRLTLRTLFVT